MAWNLTDVVDLLRTQGLDVEHHDGADEATVALAGDDPGAPRPTSVRLVASQDGRNHMLRLDALLPFRADDLDPARLAASALARYLVLGRLEVDDDGSVHHRYSVIHDTRAALPAGVLDDTVALFNYEQMHFGDYLESVCVRGFPPSAVHDLVAAGEANGLS